MDAEIATGEVAEEARKHTSHTKENPRNTNIDLLRLVAAFGVINIHVPFTTEGAGKLNALFSPLCVPFFFLTSLTYFLAGLKSTTSFNDVVSKAFKRLLLPYLCWTAIYVGLMMLKHAIVGEPNVMEIYKVVFYGESAVHLYFLPQLFVAQLVTLAVYFMFGAGNDKKIQGVGVFLLAATYYIIGNLGECFGVLPVAWLVFYLVSASLAVAAMNAESKWPYTVAGILVLLLPVIISSWEERPDFVDTVKYLPVPGLGLVLVAIGLPQIKLSRFFTRLSRTSFGIYLSHVVFLEAILFVLNRVFPGRIEQNFLANLAITVAVFLMATIFTVLTARIPILRRGLLGLAPRLHTKSKKRRRSSKKSADTEAA